MGQNLLIRVNKRNKNLEKLFCVVLNSLSNNQRIA